MSVTEFWRDPRENVFDLGKSYHAHCLPEYYVDLHHVSEYLVGIFKQFIPEGSSVLEIGANCGRNLWHLNKAGYYATGVEINPIAIALKEKNIYITESSVEEYLPKVESRDCILSQSVMMHLPPESEFVFAEMARIATWLVVNEVEHRNSIVVWKRNYAEVFGNLGFEQIHSQRPDCGTIKGMTRVFRKL